MGSTGDCYDNAYLRTVCVVVRRCWHGRQGRRVASPYSTAEHDNFDKYLLFIERSTQLVKQSGRIGMIVPHKFMTIQSGRALRRLIATGRLLREVVPYSDR